LKIKVGDKKIGLFQALKNQKYIFIMAVPFIVWLFIFKYIPIWGWTMGFQDFQPGQPIKWVGLTQFIKLFQEPRFYLTLRNTFVMSILNLVFGTLFAIGFAVFLNEMRFKMYKRVVQTISYLPYFVSWVIVASIFTKMLAISGPINEMLINVKILKEPISFFGKKEYFWALHTGIWLWKSTGWNAIIYLAAIAGINPELYEAATIDGAGRFRKIWNITLPSILPTITVIMIMNIGWLINIGFESQFLLKNYLVIETAEVLDLYVINYGIRLNRYSYGTAIGIFKSLVSIVLVIVANRLAKRARVSYIF